MDINRLKAERWKKIYQTNTNQKKTRETILKSNQISEQKL